MYKLTHVQTTLRNELSEEIQDNKVHPSNTRFVNDNLEKGEQEETKKENKKSSKEYFTINAFNYSDNSFEVEVEKVDSKLENLSKGVFIDKKK